MKRICYLFIATLLLGSCVQEAFLEGSDVGKRPTGLKYMSITNARETKTIISNTPTINANGLIPLFEVIGGFDGAGNQLDATSMNFVSIANPDTIQWTLENKDDYFVNEKGDTIKGGISFDTSKAGVINISEGHTLTVGDYYFTIKVTTKKGDETFSTTFDKVFHVNIEPLLPTYLIYQLKTQNLIAGDPNSKTRTPIMPNGNKNVRFSLLTDTDKLGIDPITGVVTLLPSYAYVKDETIRPTIEVTSNISEEKAMFSNSLVVIVTDTPKSMPMESIYFFYPTLATSGSFPTGGDGYTVQTLENGVALRIWSILTNSTGKQLVAPDGRPKGVNAQVLETTTNTAAETKPVTTWCVMATQDLSLYNVGYNLSMGYHYLPGFQTYMADGRTPTDLEVYISTDYTGGAIQNTNGTWTGNGTWTQINRTINSSISKGVAPGTSVSNGTNWGDSFWGTPYPGDQKGDDPDGLKDPERGTVYGKWIKCNYDITQYKNCKTFTVAFKIASYFKDALKNSAAVPGRGGSYFLSDFHYVATELMPE